MVVHGSVLILMTIIPYGYFKPAPLHEMTINLNMNGSPFGTKLSSDEFKTEVKAAKISSQADSICKERYKKVEMREKRKPRILRGIPVKCAPRSGEPPWRHWIVSIKTDAGTLDEYGEEDYDTCGGVLISRKHILTALHCLLERDMQKLIEPQKVQIFVNSIEEFGGEMFTAQEFYFENKPNVIFYQNTGDFHILKDDLAVIKLDKEIPPEIGVNPILLPKRAPQYEDKYWVAGWGAVATDPQYDFPTTLRQFLQKNANKVKCPNNPIPIIAKKYLCFKQTNFGKSVSQGTCLGDSGGPGVTSIKDPTSNEMKWYLQGIVSFSSPATPNGKGFCNETFIYGVDMNVWRYKDRIEKWMNMDN